MMIIINIYVKISIYVLSGDHRILYTELLCQAAYILVFMGEFEWREMMEIVHMLRRETELGLSITPMLGGPLAGPKLWEYCIARWGTQDSVKYNKVMTGNFFMQKETDSECCILGLLTQYKKSHLIHLDLWPRYIYIVA